MFTGIVQQVGHLAKQAAGRYELHTGPAFLQGVQLGDSIAVSGVCLTVVALTATSFAADVSEETLRCTTLGALVPGVAVNLERALSLGTPLGGHLVSGHVDGVGRVRQRNPEGQSEVFWFDWPPALARFIAIKGSVCVDGVSLTVNTLDGQGFAVNLVPHTCQRTTLGALVPGAAVNLEVDVVARYVARFLEASSGGAGD